MIGGIWFKIWRVESNVTYCLSSSWLYFGWSQKWVFYCGYTSITFPAEAQNYPSATCPVNRDKVKQLILDEVLAGHYHIVDGKPKICSPQEAMPKANGSMRLIHDGSQPVGSNMNSFAFAPPISYQSLDDTQAALWPGSFIAKVDLKAAYRSVRIKDSDEQLLVCSEPLRVTQNLCLWSTSAHCLASVGAPLFSIYLHRQSNIS